MRLLYTTSDERLMWTEDLIGDKIPPYAILSHTWREGQEVTLADLKELDKAEDMDAQSKEGYQKLRFCAKQAKRDGLNYFWVDTCCIDKSNSSELQEAINSMYRWYQNAAKCYVYLSDVEYNTSNTDDESSRRWKPFFRKSRWFTRGWTLQELLAPASVEFYSKEGVLLGNKKTLQHTIHEITGIPVEALSSGKLFKFDIAERFSWAQNRHTTREEDGAYCLFGLFGVHLPLIYGEGRKNALARLEEQIEKSSKDALLSLDEEQTRMLIDSLRFDQIDARQMTIKTAHAKTCRWLLKSEQYLNWLDTTKLDKHHGFLWIKGNAGTGKSTLMKFALVNARKTMKDHTVLSFFFNARGEDIERSTTGTYRSLLLQLLERLPVLQSAFDPLNLSTSKPNADHQRNVESLKTLLEQAVRGLGDSSVVCFIDALDECEDGQVRDMIQFFEHIGDLAVSNGISFQVCFSSRHYPYITIRNGLELVLEGQEGHSQDITNYIETELKIGKSKIAQQIRVELQEKASGIFMWVVLVVGILNKESDRGQVHTLRRKLQEIPGDLHELFRDILTRDTYNRDGLVLCIQWILFAKQPLSPEQLYHAILSGVDLEAVTEWDPEEITKDVVKRFILDSSKGLAEVTVSKEPKVQFIHESVRDFLLKENGLGKIWPEFGSNFQGQSHERLKQCCLNYIGVDVATPLRIPADLPKASSQPATSLRESATQTFPFLEYAVHNVLYHADAAEGESVSQADFLDSFPLPRWVKLDNLFEKREVRRHTERVSLLYLLAELNMANLIGVLGSASRCMDVEPERYGCPLFAAAAMSSEKALEVCMDSVNVLQGDSSPIAAVGEQQSQHKTAQRAARRDFKYSKSKNFLLNAAELGHDEILTLLLRLGKPRIHSEDSRGRTVLWWASRNGCDRAVRSLLGSDPAFVNSKDKDNQNPLYIATEQGNTAVVALLLDNGADVNAQGGRCGNALQMAVASGHKGVVTLLLDKGADVNAQGGYHGNALQAAVAGEVDKEVVTLLLDKGADVNAQGGRLYANALYAAVAGGHKEVVTLLLDKGADVNAQGEYHGNALQMAVASGHKEVVTLLLDKGADVNAQGGYYGNALQAASSNGSKEVVTLLLDKGADVNAKSGLYSNALQAASSNGSKEVVTLLLEKGADVNAEGGYHGNALQAASSWDYKQVVKMLLDAGAHQRQEDYLVSRLE